MRGGRDEADELAPPPEHPRRIHLIRRRRLDHADLVDAGRLVTNPTARRRRVGEHGVEAAAGEADATAGARTPARLVFLEPRPLKVDERHARVDKVDVILREPKADGERPTGKGAVEAVVVRRYGAAQAGVVDDERERAAARVSQHSLRLIGLGVRRVDEEVTHDNGAEIFAEEGDARIPFERRAGRACADEPRVGGLKKGAARLAVQPALDADRQRR